MDIVRIETIDQLLKYVGELNNVTNHKLWFRGVSDKNFALMPSIQRKPGLIEKERFFTNDFYIRAKRVLQKSPEKQLSSSWLSIMQHYGIPTRMLDWSESPLIATFFACEKYSENPNVDACVWIIVPSKLNELEGFSPCIYPSDALTAQKMITPAFKETESCDVDDKILACYCTENDLRMYSQQSCFTIHNSERKLQDVCNSTTLYKIVIPSDKRLYFMQSLKVFGITESFIYPDLEHIANDLNRRLSN